MFHKVKEVFAMRDMKLGVYFADGTTKIYDARRLVDRFPQFKALENGPLFEDVQVDEGGYGVIWNDELDVSCDELWEHGVKATTSFDGLMSFADASDLWGLSESTLRKAVSYGKIKPGIDARKYGKQWIVTRDAMRREYGEPKEVTAAG